MGTAVLQASAPLWCLVVFALATPLCLAQREWECFPSQSGAPPPLSGIRLKPAGTWGSQPTYFPSRAEAVSPFIADLLFPATSVAVPIGVPLPAVIVQAMITVPDLLLGGSKSVVATSLDIGTVVGGVSVTVVPLVGAALAFNLTGPPVYYPFTAAGEANITVDMAKHAATALNMTALFAVYMQLATAANQVVASAVPLQSLPLQYVAIPRVLPFTMRFVRRFMPADGAVTAGSMITDVVNGTRGDRPITTDERLPSVSHEGYALYATRGVPLRPFGVDVAFAPGTSVRSYDGTTLVAKLMYIDPVTAALTDDGLFNNTSPVNGRGRATFLGVTPTAALGAVTALVFLVNVSAVDPNLALTPAAQFKLARVAGVPPLVFQLNVARVRKPMCSLTFVKHGTVSAYYLPSSNAATVSTLQIIAGYVLPTISIAVLDSTGSLDETARGGITATIRGASISDSVSASIVGGIATFDSNIIVSGPRTLVNALVTIHFYAGSAVGVTTVETIPLFILAVPNSLRLQPRAIHRIAFSPQNPMFPREGTPATVVQDVVLPPIQIHAADALNAAITAEIGGLAVIASCEVLPDAQSASPRCALNGTTVVPFDLDSIMSVFVDLRFSFVPPGGAARLMFTLVQQAVQSSTVVAAAATGFALYTGVVQVVPPAVAAGASIGLAMDSLAQAHFSTELGYDVALVDGVSRLPVTSFVLLNDRRAVNTGDSTTGLVATISGGSCQMSGNVAFAWQGRVTFNNLRVTDCDGKIGLLRMTFTAIDAKTDRSLIHGVRWVSGPLQYFPFGVAPLGWTRIVGAQSVFRHAEFTYMFINAFLPVFTIGVVSSSSGDDPTSVTSTSAGPYTLQVDAGSVNAQANLPTTVNPTNGTVTYDVSIQSLPNLIASTFLHICNRALVVPCMRRQIIFQYGWQTQFRFVQPPIVTAPALQGPFTIVAENSISGVVASATTVDGSLNGKGFNPTPSGIPNGFVNLGTSEPVAVAASPNVTGSMLRLTFNSTGGLVLPRLVFASPSDALTDGMLFITLTSDFRPQSPASQPPAYLPLRAALYPPLAIVRSPLPANGSYDLRFYVFRPSFTVDVTSWAANIAQAFQIDPEQLVLIRVRDSQLTATRTALTTVIEARIVAPFSRDPQKSSIAQVAERMTAFEPTCAYQTPVDMVGATNRSQPFEGACDGLQLAEWIEAAAHCEAFSGADFRCSCYEPLFVNMGERCKADSQVLSVCVYASECTSDAIKSVCGQVVPNVYLRIFLVVGGTALALAVLTGIVRGSDRLGKRTDSYSIKNAQDDLRAEREHHNDVFL